MGKTKKTQPRGLGRGRRRNFGELRSDLILAKSMPIKFYLKTIGYFGLVVCLALTINMYIKWCIVLVH